MGRKHARLGGLALSLLALCLSGPSPADMPDPETTTAVPTAVEDSTPSLELLLFLAEWSDEQQWLDPLALDEVMQEGRGRHSEHRTRAQQRGGERHEQR